MTTNKARPAVRGAALADLKRLRRQAESQAAADVPAAARPGADVAGNRGSVRSKAAGIRHTNAPPAILSQEDIALFRQAVRHVQPMKPGKAQRLIKPPATIPNDIVRNRRERATDEQVKLPAAVSDHYTPAALHHDDATFVRNRHSIQLIKQLQQGRWPVGATLDLHGSTLEQARERMDRFLQSCLEHNIRCVRIVHGKGYGSKDGDSVLRTTLRRWLSQLQAVQAYAQCAEAQGGAGALDVLLRE